MKSKQPVNHLNRWFFILLWLFYCFSANAQSLSIQGTVESAGNRKVFLEYDDGTGMVEDSTVSKNGQFAFGVKKSADQQFTIKLDSEQSFTFFYTDPVTKVRIKSPIDQSYVENPSANQFDRLKHQQVVAIFNLQNQPIIDRYKRLKKKYRDAKGGDTLAIKDSLNHSEGEMALLPQKRLELEFDYLKDNPRSLVSVMQLSYRATNSEGLFRLTDFTAAYYSLPEDVKETYQGKRLQTAIERLRRITAVNVPFPDFRAVDIHKDTVSVSKYKGQKYVLIDFWASWCIPCRADHPQLIELYKKYQSFVEVVSISLDDDLNAWKEAINEDKVGLWIHLAEKENPRINFRSKYDIGPIPVRILVNQDGKIIKRWQGQDEMHMQELLGMLKTIK